jgi:hypothetical protein
MRKSPGHVPWVRASSLIMCKEDFLKLYKIEFATELIKWFLNGRLVKMMFFPKFSKRKSKSPVQKMTKPRGNILDILLGLGL